MSYWGTYSKLAAPIVEGYKDITNEKFVLIDGGAAGNISEPFDVAGKIVTAVRFEPRGEGAVTITDNNVYIDGGLWSEDCTKDLHLARIPSTSSICPPNIPFLEKLEHSPEGGGRETIRKISVVLRSIDSCVDKMEMPLPNFIKLDIHSAEVPALIGAKNSLENCVGLLVETWNSEVHMGQGLHYQVEQFALENGFEVYDNKANARWSVKHKDSASKVDRGRYIGSEMLFIKKNAGDDLRFQKALTLSLFGFFNEAKNCLIEHKDTGSQILYDRIDLVQKLAGKSAKVRLKNLFARINQVLQ
jgi:hypothetical protein